MSKNIKKQMVKPAFTINNNVIVLSSSNYYAPYLGVCLQSIIDTSSSSNNYDILIIQKDMSLINQKRLKSIISDLPNFSIRFVNIAEMVEDINFFLNGERISQETYYGLFLPWLLKNYHKVLTMDCDMIVTRDIAELYNTDITNHLCAGVPDVILQGFLRERRSNWRAYYSKLGINDPNKCFNGGLILINTDAFRSKYRLQTIIKMLNKYKLRVVDQDMFNLLVNGQSLPLDQKWNHMTLVSEHIIKAVSLAPKSSQREFYDAHKDPYIIHFAGDTKPWLYPEIEFADLFWTEARKTVFYEELLQRLSLQHKVNSETNNEFCFNLIRSGDFVYYIPFWKVQLKLIKKSIDWLLTPFFPKCSAERMWLSKHYRNFLIKSGIKKTI